MHLGSNNLVIHLCDYMDLAACKVRLAISPSFDDDCPGNLTAKGKTYQEGDKHDEVTQMESSAWVAI